MSFLDELRRRNVLRVAAAYLVAAWLIVQVANEILPLFGFDESVSRIIVIVLAVGFIPAVLLAWVFELTPDGIARDAGGGVSADPAAIKRFDRIVILVLTAAVVFFIADRLLRPEPNGDIGANTIAVLPFVNMSSDPEQEYFGDGIAEELLNLLEKVPGLLVTSRTSSFQFKNRDMSLQEIADKLGVVHILEGSVRKSGNTLRITAQLIDSRADRHVWSETFDHELVDIFEIQDEVAARVVQALQIELNVEMPVSERHDPEAYALYLKARSYLQSDDLNALDEVERLLSRALEIDPTFIEAEIAMSGLYSRRIRFGMLNNKPELIRENFQRKNALLESLRERAPEESAVLIAIAFDGLLFRGELHEPAELLEQATALAPRNFEALLPSMVLAASLNDVKLAIAIAEYHVKKDPLSFWARSNLGDYYAMAGQFDSAVDSYRIAANLSPDTDAIHWRLASAQIFAGRPEEALETLDLETWLPYVLHGKVTAYHTLGNQAASKEALVQLQQELEGRNPWLFGFARAYAWLGDADEAFRYIYELRNDSPSEFTQVAVNPYFRPIHDDPRWPALVQEIEEITSQISFNPTLPPEITSKR